MAELQEQIDAWGEDKLKTDRFIELVKRYTDFSELTTPMLNEFVEKVIVHEGIGRGNGRRQRVDIHLNFIGAFEVPAEIVTPMELEEQRRQQEEKEAHEKELQARFVERNERYKAEKRAFTARMRAGQLTAEEQEARERKLEYSRAWQKEWREKRKAAEPPKPPKPLSKNDRRTITGAVAVSQADWKTVSALAKEGQKSRAIIRDLRGQNEAQTAEIAGMKLKLKQYGEGIGIKDNMRYSMAMQRAPRRLSETVADIMRQPPEHTAPERSVPQRKRGHGMEIGG